MSDAPQTSEKKTPKARAGSGGSAGSAGSTASAKKRPAAGESTKKKQTKTAGKPANKQKKDSVERIEQIAAGVRRRVFEHVLKHDGGYLSQALSAGEIFGALYGGAMRLAPCERPLRAGAFTGVPGSANGDYRSGDRFNGEPAPELDRFLFSPAHYALVLYAALIEVGRLDESALDEFNVDGSTLEMIGAEHSPGVATTTGSLAQALSQACGITLARRMRDEPGRTWVFMSDGEFQEGQTWEALAFASFHGLSRLRAVVDANGQQCDGAMSSVGNIEPVVERIRSFGCDAVEVDGHDAAALEAAMSEEVDKPYVIVARTDPARGLEVMARRAPLLHYVRFTSADERADFDAAFRRMLKEAPQA